MAGRGRGKSKDSSNKGSRQKDRDDEDVTFESVVDAVRIDRPGSANFIQVERKETIGVKSGNVTSEFVQLQPGFYNDDDEPRFQKGVKGVTWHPTMTGQIAIAIEATMNDEEYKETDWPEDED